MKKETNMGPTQNGTTGHPTTKVTNIKDSKLSRQQLRKIERDAEVKQKADTKERLGPVSKIEFYAYIKYLETTIAVMDAFLVTKYGDEYQEFIKTSMDNELKMAQAIREHPEKENVVGKE